MAMDKFQQYGIGGGELDGRTWKASGGSVFWDGY